MDLKLLKIEKTFSGLYIVTVCIGLRTYDYFVQSAFALNLFEQFYARGFNGKALNVLKKFNVKKEVSNNEGNR